MPPSRSRLLTATFAIYIFWGSAYLAMRVGLRTLPPLLLAGTRLLLAGLLMGAYAWLRGARVQSGRQVGACAIAGALLFLGGHGFLYWGQARVSAGVAAVLFATIPLWMVLIEGLSSPPRSAGLGLKGPQAGASISGQRGRTAALGPAPVNAIRLGWRAVSGLVLGTLGVLLLVGPAALLGAGRVSWPGALAIVIGALSWAIGSLYCSKAPLPHSAALAGALEMLIGGALLVAAAPLLGETRGFHWAQVSAASWLAIGYLVLFASMIGFSCYLWLLKKASPARVSTYAYVTPLVAVFLGWALLGEAITARTLAAIALLLGAVVLIVRQQSKRGGSLLAAEMESQGAVTS